MRTDLLLNNFVEKAVKTKRLEIFEPNFRRNYIHVKDIVDAFVFAIENFDKLKNHIYNLGLSSANITKIQLARKIKKYIKDLEIKIIKNRKDPDKEIILSVIEKLKEEVSRLKFLWMLELRN